MKKLILLILFFISLSFDAKALIRTSASSTQVIGGVAIGSQGSSGIYSGYTMSGGDDFNSSLNVVNISNPLANYFSTIDYEEGARGTTGLLGKQWDSDPYNTGSQDINRGVALGSDNMNQSNSVLNITARINNASETGKIGSGRTLISGIVHTGGYVGVSPPCIIEAYIKLPSGTIPSGWHPTFWILNSSALNAELQSGSPGSLEFDMEANTSDGSTPTALQNNQNVHGTVTGWTNGTGSAESVFDGTYHLLSMVLTSSSIKYYVDGVLKQTSSGDTTVTGKPYYILFTNHIINPTTIADWTTAGATGMSYSVDYYRMWIPNANYPTDIIRPIQNLPTLQVDYNTSMTYTFPSAAALWGSGFSGTDYCQGIKNSDFEPGSSTNFTGNYLQFPAGLSYNSSTRVLTGVTTDKKPGRIPVSCAPYIAGGAVGYVARGYIDVGPNVTVTTANYSNGTGSLDVYFLGDCGTLLPKTLAITGLPSGLTFSPSTGLITGTASLGTYTISFSVTNSSGQNATQNIALTVGS